MTMPFRYTLICLVTLQVTGCGGSSSSSSSSAPRTINSAPSSAEFYDADGVLVSRMQFEYPDELTIDVELHSVGEDMIWDTEDDTSLRYLECLYMLAPTPLLRYPDQYFRGMNVSPMGALGLAFLGIANNELIKCPVRSGRRLQQESGYAGDLFMSGQIDSYSYLVNAELEHFGGTATETINYQIVGVDTTVADVLEQAEFEVFGVDLDAVDEPEQPIIGDHTQITTVLYDAEQRPLSIDLVADSPWTALLDEYCMEVDTIVIHFKLLRDCSSVRETRSYRYFGNSVEEDIQRYNGSTPADISTSTATRLSDRVIVYSGTADDGPTSVVAYQSYPFNQLEQVTAMASEVYGDDGIWGTEDDFQISFSTYLYDGNGKLYETRLGTQRNVYDYYPDGKLKQVDVFGGQSVVPFQRTLVSYRGGSPAQITVLRRVEGPDDDDVLRKHIVLEFAPSDESWLPLFAPVAPFPGMPPSVDDVMRFQPIR